MHHNLYAGSYSEITVLGFFVPLRSMNPKKNVFLLSDKWLAASIPCLCTA